MVEFLHCRIKYNLFSYFLLELIKIYKMTQFEHICPGLRVGKLPDCEYDGCLVNKDVQISVCFSYLAMLQVFILKTMGRKPQF